MADDSIRYKRSKFSTRLPTQRLYTAGHLWLWGQPDDSWRVGFTKFALRMLGDPVEFEFEIRVGAQIEMGQTIGWVEGFKAVTDVFSPMNGVFQGPNPELEADITLLQKAPYDKGWLFGVHGTPDEGAVDAQGYAGFLDDTIDRMLGQAS